MVKFTHSYHRLVQWTLTCPAIMVAHCDHIAIGRFVDSEEWEGEGSHIRTIAKCTRMQWLGSLEECPSEKFVKMRCFAIVSEDVLSLKCLSYSLICSS